MIHVYSHAKVNLFLNIIGRHVNGCHNIQSYFLKLRLADEIYAKPLTQLNCSVEGEKITDENIVIRVIHYLHKLYNISNGANIHIKKNIPIAAGLGGGASNAATILKLLPKLWGVQEVSSEKLRDIAFKIGADIPFFYNNQNACVEGIGEVLTPIKLKKKFFMLLINPKIKIISKEIYASIATNNFSPKIVLDYQSIMKEIFYGKNDLEKYVKQKHPIIRELLKKIRRQSDCLVSRMSGSGSTCFGIFDKKIDVINAKTSLLKSFPNFWTHHEEVLI